MGFLQEAKGEPAGAELEECEVRGSPSGSKVRFSVRVRLLHLSNHLNRGELAEKAAIGDAEKSTSGDNQDLCVVAATKSIPVAEKGGDCLVCGEWYPKEFLWNCGYTGGPRNACPSGPYCIPAQCAGWHVKKWHR